MKRFYTVTLLLIATLFLSSCQDELLKKHGLREGQTVVVTSKIRLVGNAPFSKPAITYKGAQILLKAKTAKDKKAFIRAQGKDVSIKGTIKLNELTTRTKKYKVKQILLIDAEIN
jgi:hypothetical protein